MIVPGIVARWYEIGYSARCAPYESIREMLKMQVMHLNILLEKFLLQGLEEERQIF